MLLVVTQTKSVLITQHAGIPDAYKAMSRSPSSCRALLRTARGDQPPPWQAHARDLGGKEAYGAEVVGEERPTIAQLSANMDRQFDRLYTGWSGVMRDVSETLHGALPPGNQWEGPSVISLLHGLREGVQQLVTGSGLGTIPPSTQSAGVVPVPLAGPAVGISVPPGYQPLPMVGDDSGPPVPMDTMGGDGDTSTIPVSSADGPEASVVTSGPSSAPGSFESVPPAEGAVLDPVSVPSGEPTQVAVVAPLANPTSPLPYQAPDTYRDSTDGRAGTDSDEETILNDDLEQVQDAQVKADADAGEERVASDEEEVDEESLLRSDDEEEKAGP